MVRTTRLAALSLLLLSLGGQALAADAPKPRMACMSSAMSLCPSEVAARDRQAVKLCLWKNLDKVSPDCREAIDAARAAHGGGAPAAVAPH